MIYTKFKEAFSEESISKNKGKNLFLFYINDPSCQSVGLIYGKTSQSAKMNVSHEIHINSKKIIVPFRIINFSTNDSETLDLKFIQTMRKDCDYGPYFYIVWHKETRKKFNEFLKNAGDFCLVQMPFEASLYMRYLRYNEPLN